MRPTSSGLHDDRQDAMTRLTSGLPTKAAKVRALDAAGYRRPEIAEFLGMAYQHVRNVLGPVGKATRRMAPAPEAPSVPARLAPTQPDANEEDTAMGFLVVDEQGRIELPESVREAIGARPGREITWHFEDDAFMLLGRQAGLRWAQALALKYKGDSDELLSEHLIAERRREAAKEALGYPDREDRRGGLKVADERVEYDAGG